MITEAAITAAAKSLHDEDCLDGAACKRWERKLTAHIRYYRDRACAALAAAEPFLRPSAVERDDLENWYRGQA